MDLEFLEKNQQVVMVKGAKWRSLESDVMISGMSWINSTSSQAVFHPTGRLKDMREINISHLGKRKIIFKYAL